jgi:dephospho-CoA kinase
MEELHSEAQQAEPPAPKIIGLTGGIGSGKTTVAKFIEEFGFPVYYSDDRAKDIVNDNEDLKIKSKNFLEKNLMMKMDL